MNSAVNKINSDLEKGFYGFWVRRFRVSYLVIFLLIVYGIFSLYSIPKESSPDIKFGIIGVTTVYPGVNPGDMDSLITDKLEKKIKNVDGIKKITSTSAVGVSSITIELNNGVDVRNALSDIKDQVDKTSLPEDANTPSVIELSTSSDLMFEVLLYGDSNKYTKYDLTQKAQVIKNSLEGKIPGLSSIDLVGANMKMGFGDTSSDYEINVLLDKDKIEQLNLSLVQISNIIKSYNKNTPIGNYSIGDLNYDFRFDGELSDIEALKNVVIRSTKGSNILLGDIASFEKKYKDESIKKLGFKDNKGLNYVSLSFNKNSGVNVFDVSGVAKDELKKLVEINPEFNDLGIFYVNDMSELILDDYSQLSSTALQTFILVFITILLFVGLRESLIASILIPLSFLITFITLDVLGFSLNFLTNFSLVLTLGIAIDTVIVIIEASSEKMKSGYNKKSAVLLAVRDYKAPLISGTLTTLAAFLPLMFLPGVMGKFLAYIPITVFSTLVAALVLALTVSSTLFIKFVKDSKYYHIDEKAEATMSPSQKEFLEFERIGKIEKKEDKLSFRDRILNKMSLIYYELLKKVILSKSSRRMFIFSPILVLILTFVFLSPKIGFILFPKADNAVINISIETKEGTNKESLIKYVDQVDNAIYKYDELKVYNMTISGNKISIYIELLTKKDRDAKGLKNVFEVEKLITSDLKVLESEGLNVSIETLSSGPPTGKAVGIKLVASNSSKIDDLKETASIFKEHLRTIEGLKNVTTTSSESPGQFIFRFNRDKLANVGLTPNDILGEVYFYTNGIKAGSIKSDYEDNDIVLKIAQFEDNLSPEDIDNLMVNTSIGKVRVGDFITTEFAKSISSITRENGRVSITVEADINTGILPSELQPKVDEYAKNYNYPDGVFFEKGGENQENSDLIISTFKSLFIALFLIFSILVFQFNSFRQPIIIMYSVILALLGVNIGLFVTGNPYSMPFMIGFIALTGVVVNDAIILIDRINKNLEKGIDALHSVASAGKSRLQPIIVTTLTTVFGVLPLAMQDEFWAGLGFTIVFGLTAGSAMTLFVIPSLYYSWFLDGKEIKTEDF
ncbi:MAG: efflux RND transporter permease subunit [Candidatus Gracilibacteria bacterium]|nr:efflux RND transporter permease subunit [Candidatus Gracilibacteria bacterium]